MVIDCTTGKTTRGYTVGAVRDVGNTQRGVAVIAEDRRIKGFRLPAGQKS